MKGRKMISDRLFEKAFAYKKTKLWKQLWDSQLFAVELSDGRLGYVSIMGKLGEHCALALYIGAEALHSGYFSLYQTDSAETMMLFENESPFKENERLLRQECLQCIFDRKDMLEAEELEAARSYARRHGIRMAGAKAYPQLWKFVPNHYPWMIKDDEDQRLLGEALEAAVALAKVLEDQSQEEIGLTDYREEKESMLLIKRSEEGFTLGRTEIPAPPEKHWPQPKLENEIALAYLKKMKKAGIWQCELIHLLEPVQEKPDEAPVFPMMLMSVEQESGFCLPMQYVCEYEENPDELMEFYLAAVRRSEVCPAEILARDQRTYVFLKGFCGKLGIPIRIEEQLPMLDQVERDFAESFELDEWDDDDYDMDDMDDVGDMDDLLEEMEDMLKTLMETDPEVLSQFLDRMHEGKNGRTNDNEPHLVRNRRVADAAETPDWSYVISVSLGTGCYRHIKIAAGDYLCDLHDAIQDAFDFDNDHLYAFFMDDQVWSRHNGYSVDSGIGKSTMDVRLCELGLYKDKKFKYLFDFGDEWRFQCKVLREEPGAVKRPQIVRSKGESPDQYGGDWW